MLTIYDYTIQNHPTIHVNTANSWKLINLMEFFFNWEVNWRPKQTWYHENLMCIDPLVQTQPRSTSQLDSVGTVCPSLLLVYVDVVVAHTVCEYTLHKPCVSGGKVKQLKTLIYVWHCCKYWPFQILYAFLSKYIFYIVMWARYLLCVINSPYLCKRRDQEIMIALQICTLAAWHSKYRY